MFTDPLATEHQHLHTLLALQRWREALALAARLRVHGDLEAQVVHLVALAELGDWPRLRRDAARARAWWPGEPRLHLQAARADMALGLLGQAEAGLRDGLTHAPGWAPLLRQLGRVQLLQGDVALALQTLKQGLAAEPESASAHLLLAAAHAQRGDLPAAQAAVDTALRLDPDDADALALAGQLARRRSRRRGLHFMRQALRLAPGDGALQRQFQQLRLGWWIDLAMALAVLVALALNGWAWAGPWRFAASAAAFLLVGSRLQGHGQPLWLALFCAATATIAMADGPQAWPMKWWTAGWGSWGALDALAFCLGCAVATLLLFVLQVLVHAVYWHGLRQLGCTAAALWRAATQGLLRAHLQELLARPAVRVNGLVGGGTLLAASPLVPLALFSLLAVSALPLWVWGSSRLLRPVAARITPSLAFALIGFPLMLATVLVFGWVGSSAGRQWLMAAGFAAYAMVVSHQTQGI